MDIRTTLGKQAEEFVAAKLQQQGYTVLAHNFRLRQGEIDLIAMRKDLLIFVEVKMRQEQQFDLSDVITPGKQGKIINTAKHFILMNGLEEKDARFDVALLEGTGPFTCTYIANAFNESDCTW